jgi:hypothetical protein
VALAGLASLRPRNRNHQVLPCVRAQRFRVANLHSASSGFVRLPMPTAENHQAHNSLLKQWPPLVSLRM